MAALITTTVILIMAAAAAAVYFLPTLIGWHRGVRDLGAVAAINVLLGWTLVGWAIALAMALRTASAAGPMVQIVQNMPGAPPPGPRSPAPPPVLSPPPPPPLPRPSSAAPPLRLPPRGGEHPGGAAEPERR